MTDLRHRLRSADELIETYGDDVFKHPPLVTEARLTRKFAQRDLLDPHFAKISMEFASGVNRRPSLDVRSRYLILLGQFTVTRSHSHLEDAIRGAIEARVPMREALESILLCHIYSGDTVLEPALTIFAQVCDELGALDELQRDRLPLDGPARDLEAERATWPPALVADPRADHLMEQFGWRGVSTGVHYRGTHHLDSLEYLDALDNDWGRLWETFTYQGMYSRGVLDDKTRLLCTTADCIALGAAAAASARDHMEEALEFGNSPRELLDLIFMSGLYFGFPGVTAARNVLVKILTDQGRLAEVGNPPISKH